MSQTPHATEPQAQTVDPALQYWKEQCYRARGELENAQDQIRKLRQALKNETQDRYHWQELYRKSREENNRLEIQILEYERRR